jgi:flagellar basal-body rod modification protein FlgD
MSSIGSVSGLSGPVTKNAFSDLTSEEFVKIMFTELANQDPLKPNDSSALLEQMSSLRSIQSDIDLSSKLQSMVSQNQLAAAGGLIGKYISGISTGNLRVEGEVISVSRTNEGPVLNLDNGFRVRFENVDEMIDPSIFEDPEDPADPADPSDPGDPDDQERPDDGGDDD